MKIEFDHAKDAANRINHGISLAEATQLDWDAGFVWIDERFNYDEVRMCALVPHGSVLCYVAFVDREDIRRIISLRKATRKVALSYVENY